MNHLTYTLTIGLAVVALLVSARTIMESKQQIAKINEIVIDMEKIPEYQKATFEFKKRLGY